MLDAIEVVREHLLHGGKPLLHTHAHERDEGMLAHHSSLTPSRANLVYTRRLKAVPRVLPGMDPYPYHICYINIGAVK